MAIDCALRSVQFLTAWYSMIVGSRYISGSSASTGCWHQDEWWDTGEQLYRCPLSAAPWSNMTAPALTDSSQQTDVKVCIQHFAALSMSPIIFKVWVIVIIISVIKCSVEIFYGRTAWNQELFIFLFLMLKEPPFIFKLQSPTIVMTPILSLLWSIQFRSQIWYHLGLWRSLVFCNIAKIYKPNLPPSGIIIMFLTKLFPLMWLVSSLTSLQIHKDNPNFPPTSIPSLSNL